MDIHCRRRDGSRPWAYLNDALDRACRALERFDRAVRGFRHTFRRALGRKCAKGHGAWPPGEQRG